MGEEEGECPVRLKKDVKEPALLPKKPDLHKHQQPCSHSSAVSCALHLLYSSLLYIPLHLGLKFCRSRSQPCLKGCTHACRQGQDMQMMTVGRPAFSGAVQHPDSQLQQGS